MRWQALAIFLLVGRAFAQPADWRVRRDPFDPAVIARYKQVLARDPHDTATLGKLRALYARYRTVGRLEHEYEQTPEDRPTLVVLARLVDGDGDHEHARDLLAKAAKLAPDDARIWLALGDANRALRDFEPARVAYEEVVSNGAGPALAIKALRSLAAMFADRDPYLVRLLALDAGNAELWIEHGDLRVEAHDPDGALEAYAAAERLLAHDPEHRLDVIARRGHALEVRGDDPSAEAEFRRAIALAPRGYYIANDLWGRIVEIHRRAHDLAAFVVRLEHDWPERARDAAQWAMLGRIYDALADREHAIAALDHAARAAPWDLDTTRRLIELLDATDHHAEALARYEVAARAVPGDASLALGLAERYWPQATDKAVATLQRLAARSARDVSVLREIAELYSRWHRPGPARAIYERIARLEPNDVDHWLALAKAYLETGDGGGAMAAWKRVARPNQPAALARLGELLLAERDYDDAVAVYSQAIALDATSAEYWKNRAWAYDGLGDLPAALQDAEHELVVTHERAARRLARHHVVQILHEAETQTRAYDIDWIESYRHQLIVRFEGEPADVDAGYLLADWYDMTPCTTDDLTTSHCDLLRAVLERLFKLVPDDPDLSADLVRLYRTMKEYDLAIERLGTLATLAPERAEEIDKQIRALKETKRVEYPDPIPDPEPELRRRYHPASDALGEIFRIGARLGIGSAMRGDGGPALTFGIVEHIQVTPGTFVNLRVDWSERERSMEAVSAFAASAGVARVGATTSGLALVFGAALRSERRFGARDARWSESGFALDLGVDLVARHQPVGIGARLEQWLTDGANDLAGIAEVTIEFR